MAEDSNHQSDNPGPVDISEVANNLNYQPGQGQPLPGQDVSEKAKKQMEETRKKLDKFKKDVVKKYPFTLALCIIPPQAADRFDEEMALTEEEKKTKPMHLTMIIPEEKFKEIAKIKADLVKQTQDFKPKLWLNIITPVDMANYCLDSKFDIIEAIGMSFPLYDKGILGAFRVSQIHKSLCLRKFEKYIYSYVIAGSLIRGEASKTSDIDVFVIIDDTDVKRMPRLELKEKLRGIIYQYVAEANQLAGVKTPLHVQVYLLTEFWEDVKDASPVIFGFIRDGIPLYDRGGFLPWKLLLKMGKITPSPEAIEKFMSMGEKTKDMVNRRMIDAMMDIFWSILSPSQALLMLHGVPPPNVRETVKEMKRVFHDQEKMLEKKYLDILEKITIKYYKGYEHGKIKEISGKEIDDLMKDAGDYMKRLDELRSEIEKRAQKRTLEETYDNIFKLLKHLFGNKSEPALVRQFEKELIKKGRADPKNLHILNEIIAAKRKYNTKKKPGKYEIEDIRKNASSLINQLIEYGQRCDLSDIRKMQIRVNYGKGKEKHADLFLTNPAFLFVDGKIKKIIDKEAKESNQDEFESIIRTQKGKHPEKITEKLLIALKKELGNFELGL